MQLTPRVCRLYTCRCDRPRSVWTAGPPRPFADTTRVCRAARHASPAGVEPGDRWPRLSMPPSLHCRASGGRLRCFKAPSAALSAGEGLRGRKVRRASQRTHAGRELRPGLSDSAAGATAALILNRVYYHASICSSDPMLMKRPRALTKGSTFNRNTRS